MEYCNYKTLSYILTLQLLDNSKLKILCGQAVHF